MMFSKYDVYSTVQSIYYYKDTNILKNKLDIYDFDLLKEAEEEISLRNAIELVNTPLNGRFSINHLLNIHKFLFSDIYYFAGKIRREDIFKGETRFTTNQLIKHELVKLMNELKADKLLKDLPRDIFIKKLTYYMAELNVIHPFREGNGRTIREFIRELSVYNNYSLNWGNVNKSELLDASIESVYDESALVNCIYKCIRE